MTSIFKDVVLQFTSEELRLNFNRTADWWQNQANRARTILQRNKSTTPNSKWEAAVGVSNSLDALAKTWRAMARHIPDESIFQLSIDQVKKSQVFPPHDELPDEQFERLLMMGMSLLGSSSALDNLLFGGMKSPPKFGDLS